MKMTTPLLADAFTFRTRLPNGVEIELNALAAEAVCENMESFGDDCSNGCKRMRAAIRDVINACTANIPICGVESCGRKLPCKYHTV